MKRTPAERARAARLWGLGMSKREIAETIGINGNTLWKWAQDPEFQRIATEMSERQLKAAETRMRALAGRAVDAFERGLASTHKQVKGEGNSVIDLEDNSLAVTTAKIVTERIPELMPHKGVEVEGEMADRITELIRGLDGDSSTVDHGGAHPAPALPAPPVRPDEPLDPDEA